MRILPKAHLVLPVPLITTTMVFPVTWDGSVSTYSCAGHFIHFYGRVWGFGVLGLEVLYFEPEQHSSGEMSGWY